jgi:hypothetical protein
MGLDILKLENCRKKGNKVVARCPACAEVGQDKQGNHLILYDDGRFGCVKYQGADGQEHRKRIFQLVGGSKQIKTVIDVKNPSQLSQMTQGVLIKNIMGRLGHHF